MTIPMIVAEGSERHSPPVEYFQGITYPYPETAARVAVIRDRLLSDRLAHTVPVDELPPGALEAVHDPALLHLLERTSAHAEGTQQSRGASTPYIYPSVFPVTPGAREGLLRSPEATGAYSFDVHAPVGPGTWEAARHSAAVAWSGAGHLLNGDRLTYALCRPPGHHAGRDVIGGYCYLNNTAVAAARLRNELGPGVVLDVDYHHGNGTQHIFCEDEQVSTISIHADPAWEYPFYAGYAEESDGHNLNLPLHKGTDEAGYWPALMRALEWATDKNPVWLVVAAGFDTYEGDPYCQFRLSITAYERMGQAIGRLNVPTLVVQEGGYAVDALGEMVPGFLRGMSGAGNCG